MKLLTQYIRFKMLPATVNFRASEVRSLSLPRVFFVSLIR